MPRGQHLRVHSIYSLLHPTRQCITTSSASFAAINQQATDTHTHRAAVVHYYQLDSRYWILWTQSFIAIHTQERSTSLRPVYSGHTKHICILPDFTNAAPLLLICGILRRNRSAGLGELDFPRVMSTCGGRAFANAGFTSWNSLRDNLKNVNLSLQTKKC